MGTHTAELDRLAALIADSARPVFLTGAGCSTESGIPDYRSPRSEPRAKPMLYVEFVRQPARRRRYWARSLVGWPAMARARPNAGHAALAALERSGRVHHLITQNVDGLHQAAGSERITELHGALREVLCLGCGRVSPRARLQARLLEMNPGWDLAADHVNPDGDAELGGRDTETLRVPACEVCGGVLKPRVVFFGERVPPPLVETSFARLREADLLVVIGSSLTVWSGYRFVKAAEEQGIPIAIVNRGPTRGDPHATLRLDGSIGALLPALAERVDARPSAPAQAGGH